MLTKTAVIIYTCHFWGQKSVNLSSQLAKKPRQFITSTKRKCQGRESSPSSLPRSHNNRHSNAQAETTAGRKKEKKERHPATRVHGDRTRCLVQVKAVTNHWELSCGGAEVGLIEMNFMVEEDERRRRHLIKPELFYLPFVSTSRGPKFKPVFVCRKPATQAAVWAPRWNKVITLTFYLFFFLV